MTKLTEQQRGALLLMARDIALPICKDRSDPRYAIALEAACAGILEAQRRDAELASLYIINGNSIHPDIPADQMAPNTKMIAHTTCQHIAEAIREGGHYGEKANPDNWHGFVGRDERLAPDSPTERT